jgi:SAM-dependent methyltransferase
LLFSDTEETGAKLLRQLSDVFEIDTEGRSILDCACGTGIDLAQLAKAGRRVVGSDKSRGMLERAKEYLTDRGIAVPLVQSEWSELPDRIAGSFDLVLCTGNSISHCMSRDEMARSVRGMAEMLSPSGTLMISWRNWDRIVEEKPRFWVLNSYVQENVRIIPIYIWDLKGMDEVAQLDILFVRDSEGEVTHSTSTIRLRPFGRQQLLDSLHEAGLRETRITLDRDESWYWVSATKE